jgi:hypothetical protein
MFITMYTPLYASEVDELVMTAREHGVEVGPIQIECRGSWLANVQQKAEVVHQEMTRVPHRPIVWVDADARFRAEPTLLYEMPARISFAAYFIEGVFKSPMRRPWGPQRSSSALAGGTMYFAPYDSTRNLVLDWISACTARPTVWEQQNLQRALGETLDSGELFYFSNLPQSYCKVFDCKWYPHQKGPVVIEHTQASRKLKRRVG